MELGECQVRVGKRDGVCVVRERDVVFLREDLGDLPPAYRRARRAFRSLLIHSSMGGFRFQSRIRERDGTFQRALSSAASL